MKKSNKLQQILVIDNEAFSISKKLTKPQEKPYVWKYFPNRLRRWQLASGTDLHFGSKTPLHFLSVKFNRLKGANCAKGTENKRRLLS